MRCANKAFFSRQDFDEAAEIDDATYRTGVDATNLDLFRQGTYRVHRLLHGLTRCGRDIYGPIVLDIDLGAALLLNLANHLATWPNDGANLFWIDLDRLDARGIFRQSLARSVYRIEHLFHNVHTAFAGLL